jgi:hypothetical protein
VVAETDVAGTEVVVTDVGTAGPGGDAAAAGVAAELITAPITPTTSTADRLRRAT